MRREGGALVSAKRGERHVRRRRHARNALRPGPVHLGEEVRHPRPWASPPCTAPPLRGRTRPDPAKRPPEIRARRFRRGRQSRGGGGANRGGPSLPRGDEYQHPRRRRVANRVRGSWRDDAIAVQERPVEIEHETVRLGGPPESAEKTRVDGAGFAFRSDVARSRAGEARRHQPSGSARESSFRQQTQQFVLARRHAFGVFDTRLVVEAREV